MKEPDRVPWLRLWRCDLERYVGGPFIRSISLAIDAATIRIEEART